MPELPEVETMRRGIAAIVGGTIVEVVFPKIACKPIAATPAPDRLRRHLLQARVESLHRIGKRLVFRLSTGRSLVLEPRMTGLVLLSDPPDTGHLRMGWQLRGAAASTFWFWDRRGLGTLQLVEEKSLKNRFGPDRIGPDALNVTTPQLHERLGASRRPIKVALLDQQAVAGIGNLYASEILHVASIDPQLACRELTSAQWERLAEATRHVLEEAIKYEGSTLSDGTYRNALNQSGRYQNQHRVYDRVGQQCPRGCPSTIVRIVQTQRSTFFCPTCQSGK